MFLIIPMHSLVTNVRRVQTNLIFFYILIRTDGLVLFISWVIWSFHSIGNYQKLSETRPKQGDMGSSYCSYQNQFMFYSRYVVFRNSVEVIPYSYGRGDTSVYYSSPFFFSRIYFSIYTDMSECRPRRLYFFSASSLLIICVFIHGQKSNLNSNAIDSYSFLLKAELLDKTAEVWWLKLFSFLP